MAPLVPGRLRIALLACCLGCLPCLSEAADFAKGADIGWLPQMEASGYTFRDGNGQPQDCLQTLLGFGINTVRLRVWVNPSQDPRRGHCSRDEMVALARRARKMGFRILIDFHYSDSWADPGHQKTPAAWAGHPVEQLETDVSGFTTGVLAALKAADITPEWVQVGNEIPTGMLWPEGKISGENANLTGLINAGYDAVKAVDPQTKVIVHLDRGDNNGLYRRFFDRLQSTGGKYDVIGLSYYPNLSKTDGAESTERLGRNLNDVAARYHKEVMVVEAGGPEAAPEKTRTMLAAVLQKVRAVPEGRGLGVVYWEPEAAQSWSGYPLSAWGAAGRPSVALDAFLEKNVPTTP